jgi:hypothetical protein
VGIIVVVFSQILGKVRIPSVSLATNCNQPVPDRRIIFPSYQLLIALCLFVVRIRAKRHLDLKSTLGQADALGHAEDLIIANFGLKSDCVHQGIIA